METPVDKGALYRILALVGLLLVILPSAFLIQSLEKYISLIRAVDSEVLKPSSVQFPGHKVQGPGSVQFRALAAPGPKTLFRIQAQGAARVFLAGDFNLWNPGKTPLSQAGNGWWEALVPLSPGRYRYIFQVDGVWRLDPVNPDRDIMGAQRVSVKEVPGVGKQ